MIDTFVLSSACLPIGFTLLLLSTFLGCYRGFLLYTERHPTTLTNAFLYALSNLSMSTMGYYIATSFTISLPLFNRLSYIGLCLFISIVLESIVPLGLLRFKKPTPLTVALSPESYLDVLDLQESAPHSQQSLIDELKYQISIQESLLRELEDQLNETYQVGCLCPSSYLVRQHAYLKEKLRTINALLQDELRLQDQLTRELNTKPVHIFVA